MNEALDESPDLVQDEMGGDGWLWKIKASDQENVKTLMSAEEYKTFCG